MEIKKIPFTKEMKQDYTVLVPNMAPIHFEMLRAAFRADGINAVLLSQTGSDVVETGLKYVHNDTCYPALLVIGQMICALQSGEYDLSHTALMISQTGGGCRASNYIFLLRKALVAAGFADIPVISFNVSGLEKQNTGFKLHYMLIRRMLAAVVYGDALMLLRNQVLPYEVNCGDAEALCRRYLDEISDKFMSGSGHTHRELRRTVRRMCEDFAAIPVNITPKVKVGIVGEIYVKYSALANNNLEAFLHEQDCEVMLPGLMSFCQYCVYNSVRDYELYGGSRAKYTAYKIALKYLCYLNDFIIDAVNAQGRFVAPEQFSELVEGGEEIICTGCKMGEGWVLTAEITELIRNGYRNIICTQPFGCLPNHINGKGMSRKIRERYPEANIVPIDYDPGATRVNQENRIKLMIAVAREALAAGTASTGTADAKEKSEDRTPETVGV